ncbi:MAG TPA: PRC-barrel domain-containing protein [Crinalium sp.]|jgi:uncharacterized protein YrrD/polyhydroxyalkanoate synthesis regulator phasin
MTAQSDVIRQSDLLNRLVLDRDTMEELGRLEVLWMYPPKHRVLGFICKSGFLGAKKSAFKLGQIGAIGESGILTHGQPEATNGDKVAQLESLLQHEVWSDAGNKIGKITDCLFNLETGVITAYLFVSNGWSGIVGEVYQLPPNNIVSFGKKRVLVPDTIADSFTIYQEGIQHKLIKTGETLKSEAASATEQTKKRVQSLTERAREKAQALSQQAKEKVQSLNEQLKEKTLIWTEQAREQSQDFVEQMREQTYTLSRQVEEGIQTLTVQAEEIFDTDADKPENVVEDDIFDFDTDEDFMKDEDVTTDEETEATKAVATSPEEPQVSQASSNSTAIDDDDDEPWI